ncbi:MAG: hypothetical protein QOD46_393 [Actinomycetota bacterium]|nr:hypothetical protein [Actinomycetota bacterium]
MPASSSGSEILGFDTPRSTIMVTFRAAPWAHQTCRPYSRPMLTRLLSAGAILLAGALLMWAARLLFHSMLPEPEGHWREVTLQELTAR